MRSKVGMHTARGVFAVGRLLIFVDIFIKPSPFFPSSIFQSPSHLNISLRSPLDRSSCLHRCFRPFSQAYGSSPRLVPPGCCHYLRRTHNIFRNFAICSAWPSSGSLT
ncbi:hypothetical protein PtB15_9B297 [Puccinia triticina]|nr:hypothetical protein PtB15_9B297 [Puccinia triticina]